MMCWSDYYEYDFVAGVLLSIIIRLMGLIAFILALIIAPSSQCVPFVCVIPPVSAAWPCLQAWIVVKLTLFLPIFI